MSRTPLKTTPTDVLDTIRDIVDADSRGVDTRPAPLALTEPIHPPEDGLGAAPSAGETPIVDRIVTRLDAPGGPSAPLSRQADLAPADTGTPDRDDEDPQPCTLLLTPDFQVSPPELSYLPHPVDPLAQEDYAEDSDLDRIPASEALSTPAPEMSEALRAAVSKTMRAALSEADTEETQSDRFVDDEGYIDAEALKRLVRGIVQEELRGDLGAQISRRIRVLVRAEIKRTLQINALD